jgi:hypothetical protein
MARGFESKDVEFQQAEAERAAVPRRALSPEARRGVAERESLALTLTRARADLDAATSPTHGQMLEQAIGALEARLRATGGTQ